MARKRRSTEVFSLSFLDCICCGFGAVVLFYTIISAQSGVERIRKNDDLMAEVRKLDEQVTEGARNLLVLRNTLERTELDMKHAATRSTTIIDELERQQSQAVDDSTSVARREHIAKLKSDIKSLEEGNARLRAAALDRAPEGDKVKAFRSKGGERRYITGLRLKGKRILVLVDRSASMIDDDLVNVIRLRNSPEQARRSTPKWRRTVDTIEWLSTQFPAGSQFQIFGFNTQAESLIAGSNGQWLDAGDAKSLGAAVDAMRSAVPQGGTSLVNAFTAAKAMSPTPDQIVMITDGLPTQGATPPAIRKYIDANGRMRLFDDAAKTVPRSVPIEVVLLPMKGDVQAAYRFWRLARDTGGAFLMPSRDWP